MGSDPDDQSTSPWEARRPRWGPRLFVIGVLLVLLPAGAYWWWAHAVERRFAAAVDRLKRDGEPTTPADLVPAPMSPADNAALDYRAAARALDTKGEAWKTFEQIEFDKPLGDASAAAMTRLVGAEADVLEQVRRARPKRRADWQVNYASPMIGVLLPDLGEQRHVAQLCRAAVVSDRLRGDDADAVDHLHDVFRIGRAVDQHSIAVGHLAALGIEGMGADLAVRLAADLAVAPGGGVPGRRPADVAHVRDLIRDLLDDADVENRMRAALRAERVMELDTMVCVADGRLDVAALMGVTARPGAFNIPPLPRPVILGDALLIVGHTTDVLNALGNARDWQAYRRRAPVTPAAIAANPRAHFLAGAILPSFERMVLTHYRGLAERRLAAAALALRLYAVDHEGRYPKALDELVPDYLPAVPRDPFAAGNRPIGYDGTDPSDVKLYSVGENGTDAGGSEARTTMRRGGAGRWECDDAVFHLKPVSFVEPSRKPDE